MPGEHPTSRSALIVKESQRLLERDASSVLFHDDMAEINQPFYFHEFAAHAKEHGLQFLAEADFSDMQLGQFPPAVVAAIEELGDDVIKREQYIDFLKCRRFRQTLLCRADVNVDRHINPQVIRELLICSNARATSSNVDLRPGAMVRFGAGTVSADVPDPIAKAALVELPSAWPRALTLSALTTAVMRRLGQPTHNIPPEAEERLASAMVAAYSTGFVELHTWQYPWASKRGRRPALSALARYQLQNNRAFATNLRHADVRIETPILRAALLLMDGSRSPAAIAGELRDRVQSLELAWPAGALIQNLPAEIDRAVQEAVANAMLVAWDNPTN